MAADHTHLFIPGPSEVRAAVRAAQAKPMIGHRGADFAELFANVQKRLRQVFYTASRVYVSTSSGTGLWEAASRNCVRDDKKVLHLVNGAFSERWALTSRTNGKQVATVELPWGQAVRGEMVREGLKSGSFDAVALVHNETSTGAMSPLEEVAQALMEFPDVLFLVDAVSSAGGVKIEVDRLGIDMLVASSQKCFALPPGLAFAPVSDRVLERARNIPFRGSYFDLLLFEEYLAKNQTPATPAVSLLYALDLQLDAMLTEGLEARFARHANLAKRAQAWVADNGLELFPEREFSSHTLTAVRNTPLVNVPALNIYLKQRGMQISNGYGKLRDKTFRLAHMGDVTYAEFDSLLEAISDYLSGAGVK